MNCFKHNIPINIFWSEDNHYITICYECETERRIENE